MSNKSNLVPVLPLVIATDPVTGEQFATRAGPGGEGKGKGLSTIKSLYDIFHEKFWDNPSAVHTIQRVGIVNLPLAEVANRMKEYSGVTNSGHLPYKPNFNSNSYAFTFIESLDLERPVPSVWALGWRNGVPSINLSYRP